MGSSIDKTNVPPNLNAEQQLRETVNQAAKKFQSLFSNPSVLKTQIINSVPAALGAAATGSILQSEALRRMIEEQQNKSSPEPVLVDPKFKPQNPYNDFEKNPNSVQSY
jgi:hypothetical protein